MAHIHHPATVNLMHAHIRFQRLSPHRWAVVTCSHTRTSPPEKFWHTCAATSALPRGLQGGHAGQQGRSLGSVLARGARQAALKVHLLHAQGEPRRSKRRLFLRQGGLEPGYLHLPCHVST
jgi:hypothetical protein